MVVLQGFEPHMHPSHLARQVVDLVNVAVSVVNVSVEVIEAGVHRVLESVEAGIHRVAESVELGPCDCDDFDAVQLVCDIGTEAGYGIGDRVEPMLGWGIRELYKLGLEWHGLRDRVWLPICGCGELGCIGSKPCATVLVQLGGKACRPLLFYRASFGAGHRLFGRGARS